MIVCKRLVKVIFTQIIEELPLRTLEVSLSVPDVFTVHESIVHHEAPTPEALGQTKTYLPVLNP